jgi:hypothetical protein
MIGRLICATVLALPIACFLAVAQRPGTNYDEAKVPAYTLPDPLVLSSGERVRDAATWQKRRRPEILALFQEYVYGRSFGRPAGMSFGTPSIDRQALGSTAVRKQVTIFFSADKNGPQMDLLLYLPARAKGRVPLFLGLNFGGNQSVHADPGIKLGEVWARNQQAPGGMAKTRATEKMRGSAAVQWQVEKILASGFGLATAYYFDIDPDFDDGFQNGVQPLFYKPGQTRPAPDEWGAIGAWAWGLSRALDYLETDKNVDAKHVALMGHSRLGKTAVWAGAQDARFALVISNCSGEGGAALSRRMFGENVSNLNTSFPHWFCANYKQFNDRVSELPVDQHMLLALIAPRPLYVASAAEDLWADPRGEFLSALNATPVYHLFGKKGLESEQMPDLHQPVGDTVRYHIRAGKHDVTAYDWEQYIAFAQKQFKRR